MAINAIGPLWDAHASGGLIIGAGLFLQVSRKCMPMLSACIFRSVVFTACWSLRSLQLV